MGRERGDKEYERGGVVMYLLSSEMKRGKNK